MKVSVVRGFAAALALCALGTAVQAEVDNSLASNMMKARPSEIRLYGTIAPKGSFEEKADPVYTQLAAQRDLLADMIYAGKITVPQAVAANHRHDLIRGLMDDAVRVCAQNNKTGKCTGDAAKAQKLLVQAKVELVKLNWK